MKHECKITVLETKCFADLQEQYLADPKSGPCPFFKPGDTFLLKRTPQQDDFYHLMNGKFCGEAWDAVSRYVYTALQGGSIMKGWTNDDRMMIACCNDGTRPVIFKIERIDIPENDEEAAWLTKQNFKNTPGDAYTGGNKVAFREQLDAYVRTKYGIDPEILPFSKEDYGVYRRSDTRRWFAVFIEKIGAHLGCPVPEKWRAGALGVETEGLE